MSNIVNWGYLERFPECCKCHSTKEAAMIGQVLNTPRHCVRSELLDVIRYNCKLVSRSKLNIRHGELVARRFFRLMPRWVRTLDSAQSGHTPYAKLVSRSKVNTRHGELVAHRSCRLMTRWVRTLSSAQSGHKLQLVSRSRDRIVSWSTSI